MKNWRTMLGGFFGAISIPLISQPDPAVHFAGIGLGVVAALWFGYHAADAKVMNSQDGISK